MDKIATLTHSSNFQSQKFSVVGNVNSLVSSYNFVNHRTEGDSTTFDIEPVIDFKYNTLPTSGLIRNIPYKCLYNGGDAGYPQILDKQRTFSITTSVNNDKVFHRPGDPLYYSTQASGFTSPYFCVAIDNTFFSSSSELYPILLYAPVGTWVNNSGFNVKSFICLSSAYVTTSNMSYARILSSDSDFSNYAGPYEKKDGVRYTKKGSNDDGEPRTIFRSTLVDPIWVADSGVCSIWHFNPKKIDDSIDDGYSAYYSYSKYLADGVPHILSGLDVEALTLTYHILDFVFEGEPSPAFGLSECDFNVTAKTEDITQDGYTCVMHRSSRDKFYVRYIQYKV